LSVVAVDDEPPALADLLFLLRRDPRVGSARGAGNAEAALAELRSDPPDALFLDIRMPGLSGLELARTLTGLPGRPLLVFVTAYDDTAVDAFEVGALDYVLKPVREERLAEAVRRVQEAVRSGDAREVRPEDETISVELGGTTRFLARSSVHRVEAQGDYARLHTPDGSHLLRVPLAVLEDRWRDAGFVRVHRGHLVALAHISELRLERTGGYVVRVGGSDLPVARRHTRNLKDRLAARSIAAAADRAAGSAPRP
jgi:DNA-binding LytR/AlgR family response regulator